VLPILFSALFSQRVTLTKPRWGILAEHRSFRAEIVKVSGGMNAVLMVISMKD
jgi:hypothetical protein